MTMYSMGVPYHEGRALVSGAAGPLCGWAAVPRGEAGTLGGAPGPRNLPLPGCGALGPADPRRPGQRGPDRLLRDPAAPSSPVRHRVRSSVGELAFPAPISRKLHNLASRMRPSRRARALSLVTALVATGTPARAQQDHTNLDESKVGPYTLPPLLTMRDGTPVRTAAQWTARRRPEILALYQDEV